MNERIYELAEQAGFYITIDRSGIFIPDPHTEDITEVTKKFAELIVMECFKAAMIESKGHMNPIDLMKRMKERVGVEE